MWQGYQQPFIPPPASGPNPGAAAVLGLIPGVGAMYNGQFFKGLIHVVIFAVLVSLAGNVNGIFGIFIGAWVLYQSFEAYHTAVALRNGTPLPDPLGLNEVGNWLNLGSRPSMPPQPPGAPAAGVDPTQAEAGTPPPEGQAGWQNPYQGPQPGQIPNPWAPPVPPVPPAPPAHWRKEPVGAIVLIGLGILFLLGKLDIFSYRLFDFTWPLMLIGLGVWLIVRRMGDMHGGPK
jgi:TM2 domain-containing membrane protein YozV